jgi:putative solute:sodium symporter small subunit
MGTLCTMLRHVCLGNFLNQKIYSFGIGGHTMQLTDKHREYWSRNLRLTALLLGIWFVVTFVASWYARELNEIVILGFPLGFYMGAQGSLIIFVLIIWFYARSMNKMDKAYGVHEGEEE